MASSKKDINAFQEAMLSKTKVIGNSKENKTRQTTKKGSTTAKISDANSVSIPLELLDRYKVFAKDLNISENDAIELALNHFLDLKGFLKS